MKAVNKINGRGESGETERCRWFLFCAEREGMLCLALHEVMF